jgi:cytochrome c553
MYAAFKHTHVLVVTLFLLIYLVKTFLLLANKKETLDKTIKILKIPEMAISLLFLATGIGLIFLSGEVKPILIVKIAMVFVTIPIAIIAFRQYNKILGVLTVVLLLAIYGTAEMSGSILKKQEVAGGVITNPADGAYEAVSHGKALFVANCANCHGSDGNGNKSGAKKLSESRITDAEIETAIRKGKKAMAAYEKILSDTEIAALGAYVKTLRK